MSDTGDNTTPTTTNKYTAKINMVLGAILCGRCSCGERLDFNGGQIYKRLPDVGLDELTNNITEWLESTKEVIADAAGEYSKLKSDRTMYEYKAFEFQDDITGETHRVDKMYNLVEEFRELIPVLVKVEDAYESSHLTCMIRETHGLVHPPPTNPALNSIIIIICLFSAGGKIVLYKPISTKY